MRATEITLNEVANNPYDYELDQDSAQFIDKDGNSYSIKFMRIESGVFAVAFSSGIFVDQKTNRHDSFRIFATVIDAIKSYATKNQVAMIVFSANKSEPNRVNLYKRLALAFTRNSNYKLIDHSKEITDAALKDRIQYLFWYLKTKDFTPFMLVNRKFTNEQGVAEEKLNEIYKMPPTKNSSQGMTIWAYNDAVEKKSPILYKNNNVIVFKANENLLRYIELQDGNPVLYIGLSKFLDGYKSGTVATEIAGRGKGLAQKAYLNASDILGVPIYSDTTQTDASRLGIWNKLIQQYPDRIVGYDQKTNKNLPLTLSDKGPMVNQNQPIYVDRNKKDIDKSIAPNQRNRTRILKLLPKTHGVTEDHKQKITWVKPNFDREYDEVEFQLELGKDRIPQDVLDYYIKYFSTKEDWLKGVQNGRPVVIPPDLDIDIRNNTNDKREWLNALSPQSHDPEGPEKKARVQKLFSQGGNVEMPIVLNTGSGLWLIGGKTRLGQARFVENIPAKVWMIMPRKQSVAEGEGFDQEAGIGIDGKSFKFKIRDLVAFAEKYPVIKVDPNQFADQIADREEDSTQSMTRIKKADLQYPIIVVKRKNGQLWIADGTHRVHKAILNKLPKINARIIPVDDMTPFVVKQNESKDNESKITVKPSPGKGNGLFATKLIKAGEVITSSKFELISDEDWQLIKNTTPVKLYGFKLGNKHVLQPGPFKFKFTDKEEKALWDKTKFKDLSLSGFMFINGADSPDEVNSKEKFSDNTAKMIATKDIQPGEEIIKQYNVPNKGVAEAKYAGNIGIMELIKFFQSHPELKSEYDEIKREKGAIEAMNFALNAINAELEGEPYSVAEDQTEDENITVQNNVETSFRGGYGGTLIAKTPDRQVGYLNYSIYNDKPQIGMVFVAQDYRRRGVAMKMLKALQELSPNEEIDWGITTDAGSNLRKSINYRKVPNPEIIKKKAKLAGVRSKLARLNYRLEQLKNTDVELARKFINTVGDRWNQLNDLEYRLENELYLDKGEYSKLIPENKYIKVLKK